MPETIDRDIALKLRENCQRDTSYFSRAFLNETLWSKQLEVKRSVRKHRRTLVPSAHDVGKTRVAADIICEHMAFTPGAQVICTATTNAQVLEVLWSRVRAIYERCAARGVPLGGEMQTGGYWQGATPDSYAVAKSVDKPEAMHGVHGPAVLIVVDEAEGVSLDIWRALDSMMLSEGARMLVLFNPYASTGYCADASNRPDLWNIVRIDALDHPNVVSGENVIPGAISKQAVDEIRQRHGEDSIEWLVGVRGQFPKQGSSQLISMSDLEESVSGGMVVDEAPRAGLDVARFGGDKNVVVVFDARRRGIHRESWTGLDLMETTGRAIDISRRHNARLRIDVCGMGAGVVDRARELGVTVDAVDFGSSPKGDWHGTVANNTAFRNRRAELHWVTRTLIKNKAIAIPRSWSDVWSDLVAPTYSYDSSGRIVVEDKEHMRSRIGRSPDFGDAVHIAMSNGFRTPEDYFPR